MEDLLRIAKYISADFTDDFWKNCSMDFQKIREGFFGRIFGEFSRESSKENSEENFREYSETRKEEKI